MVINISAGFHTQIEEWISAIEAWINTYCNREFETETATYKLYDGDGTKELLIDDITALTKIEILDEDGNVDYTIDNVLYYFLYPANKTQKDRVVLNPSNSPIAWFPKGNQNVKVTADFGYSATVPEDIRLAATKLVAGIIAEQNLDLAGEVKSEKLGEYAISFNDVEKMANHLKVKKDILDKYRRISV